MTDLLQGTHTVTLHTTLGDITLELDANAAPKTVTNFVTHAKNGYYNNQLFHRVIQDFMAQAGDPTGTGTGGESIYGTEFEDEQNQIALERGVIAMANRGPNTNGSQFFIIHAEQTPWLQGKHTGFGKVISGLDVLDTLCAVETDMYDRPMEDVTYTVTIA